MGSPRLRALVLTLSLAPVPASTYGAEIEELFPVIKNDRIVVSFRMGDAFTDDVQRTIASGLPVSFRYTVELKKERALWFNQKVATRLIQTVVTYDNLTERYKMSRTIDEELDRSAVVSDPESMHDFMTRFDSLDLFPVSVLEPNGEYYLRVKGVIKERNLFLFLPWDIGSGWKKAYFTYLP